MQNGERMNIGFIMTYVVCPVVIAIGAVWGKKNNNKQIVGRMLVAKGLFYLYCAGANFVNYIKEDYAIRYVIGLTIGIALMEGIVGIYDGYIQIKIYFEEKYQIMQ